MNPNKASIPVRSIVKCPRWGVGLFKVIDRRGSGSRCELRIHDVNEPASTADWIYEAHCRIDLKASIQNRKDEANKILNKEKRK